MKWLLIAAVALLMMASCASRKHVETQRIERCDTFRAVLAERLTVCLDDVIIVPRDTVQPLLMARRAEIHRVAAAELQAEAREHSAGDIVDTPVPTPLLPATATHRLRTCLLLLLLALILLPILLIRKLK